MKDEFHDDVKENDISILDTDKDVEYKEEKEMEYGFYTNIGANDAVAKNDNKDATTNARTSDIDRF